MERAGFGEMRIGEVLTGARERAGLDLREVEQRTKIRAKYLRAIEAEDWATLPSDAYAKGFLRTYAELLGLDAEALVDEYRRQVEGERAAASPIGERVLERRRRPGESPRRGPAAWIAAGIVVAIAAVLAVVGLTSDGGTDHKRGRADHAKAPAREHRPGSGRSRGNGQDGKVKLALTVHDPVEVCLLGGGGEALIDGQVLAQGTEEKYERHSFDLRFPAGFDPSEFRLEIAGEKRILPKVKGPAAFRITPPGHVEQTKRPEKTCP